LLGRCWPPLGVPIRPRLGVTEVTGTAMPRPPMGMGSAPTHRGIITALPSIGLACGVGVVGVIAVGVGAVDGAGGAGEAGGDGRTGRQPGVWHCGVRAMCPAGALGCASVAVAAKLRPKVASRQRSMPRRQRHSLAWGSLRPRPAPKLWASGRLPLALGLQHRLTWGSWPATPVGKGRSATGV
jgi:hypothetical protein